MPMTRDRTICPAADLRAKLHASADGLGLEAACSSTFHICPPEAQQTAGTFAARRLRDGDRLFVQATKQPKLEVFPESDRVFFYKVVDGRITFEVDPRGRATRLVLHQNGRPVRAKSGSRSAILPASRCSGSAVRSGIGD